MGSIQFVFIIVLLLAINKHISAAIDNNALLFGDIYGIDDPNDQGEDQNDNKNKQNETHNHTKFSTTYTINISRTAADRYTSSTSSHSKRDIEDNPDTDASTMHSDNAFVANAYYMGYVIITILCILPLLLIIPAAMYNTQFHGSDAPNYMSICKAFAYVSDLYTDIIFCISLGYGKSYMLLMHAAIFIFIAHFLSNAIGLHFINKWRRQNVKYITKYASVVFLFNLIVGFCPSIEILSSKLFYCAALSMQLSHSQRYTIQILSTCMTVVFENIALLTIQIMHCMESGEMDSYTMVAFCCSLISLTIGSLTVISRCLSTKCRFNYHFNETKILYCISIISCKLQPNHNYCHQLFEQCVSCSLEIAKGRIETVSITSIEDGIACNVEILLESYDKNNIYKILNGMINNDGDVVDSFKKSLIKTLQIEDCKNEDIEISITKLNANHDEEPQRRNEGNNWQKYRPFNQQLQTSTMEKNEIINIQMPEMINVDGKTDNKTIL